MVGQQTATPILGEATIQEFKAALRGELLRPADNSYDAARRVWNGMIDKHPALIACCTGVADVITAVQFARSQHLLVAVRSGGHNVAGSAVCDGGLVIDLSRMKGSRLDPTRRTIRAEAGLTWGEFDRETQMFGLATTGGRVSTTGIAGLTLGGGLGWLLRTHGLTCDNLLAVDLVTADGRFLTASPTENAELFWAVRGGGGNFGVVTSFEYQLHPVNQALGGVVLYRAEEAREVLRFYRAYVATAPDELNTLVAALTISPASSLPRHLHGMSAIGIYTGYIGAPEEGERVLAPLRAFGAPLADLIGPMSYGALQTMFDATNPRGLQQYWTSHYLPDLSDAAIDIVVDYAATATSSLSQLHLHHLQGAGSRVASDAMAYSHRDAAYALNILATWTDAAAPDEHIRWARSCWQAMRPYATGGVYVNFTSREDDGHVRGAYGANYARLAALKQVYDPTNFFRLNQNILPTAT